MVHLADLPVQPSIFPNCSQSCCSSAILFQKQIRRDLLYEETAAWEDMYVVFFSQEYFLSHPFDIIFSLTPISLVFSLYSTKN